MRNVHNVTETLKFHIKARTRGSIILSVIKPDIRKNVYFEKGTYIMLALKFARYIVQDKHSLR